MARPGVFHAQRFPAATALSQQGMQCYRIILCVSTIAQCIANCPARHHDSPAHFADRQLEVCLPGMHTIHPGHVYGPSQGCSLPLAGRQWRRCDQPGFLAPRVPADTAYCSKEWDSHCDARPPGPAALHATAGSNIGLCVAGCMHDAGKTTLLQLIAGKYLVGRDVIRVLGSSPFYDTVIGLPAPDPGASLPS